MPAPQGKQPSCLYGECARIIERRLAPRNPPNDVSRASLRMPRERLKSMSVPSSTEVAGVVIRLEVGRRLGRQAPTRTLGQTVIGPHLEVAADRGALGVNGAQHRLPIERCAPAILQPAHDAPAPAIEL